MPSLHDFEALTISGYTVRYQGLSERQTDHATEVRASLLVSKNGKSLGGLEAGKNSYKIAGPEPQVSSIMESYFDGSLLRVVEKGSTGGVRGCAVDFILYGVLAEIFQDLERPEEVCPR